MINLTEYGPSARLVCLDDDGLSYAIPTPTDLAEYVSRGTVRGHRDHSIGVRWTDDRGNDMAVALSPEECR
jgi:hypothetical protein